MLFLLPSLAISATNSVTCDVSEPFCLRAWASVGSIPLEAICSAAPISREKAEYFVCVHKVGINNLTHGFPDGCVF